MTKRILALLLVLCMAATMLVACDKSGKDTGTTIAETKPDAEPTEAPTEKATEAPDTPTEAPTEEPTEAPTEKPTEAPTEVPTEPSTEPADGIYDTAADKAHYVVLSFDECEAWAGETELMKFFTPGQPASCAEITDIPGETTHVRLWGWLAFTADFKSVGYKLDDAKPVFDNEWLVEADPAVVGAAAAQGGDYATRFRTWVDVSALTPGEHTIKALYKLADNTVVCYHTVKINIGYRKPVLGDASVTFKSDVASQSDFASSDLSNVFMMELPINQCGIEDGKYKLAGICDFVTTMDGQYSVALKDFWCQNAEGAYFFIRGTEGITSDDVPGPDTKINDLTFYPINNYYETDGHPEGNSTGGAGICISRNDGGLTVTIKAFDAEWPSRVANYRFNYACETGDILITDDNNVVNIYADRALLVSIAMNGSAAIDEYAGLHTAQDVHFVKTVTLTGADGTVNTVENTLVVDNAASDIGAAARATTVLFSSMEINPLSKSSIPGVPVYIVFPDFIKSQFDGGTPATIQQSELVMHDDYVTLTSTDSDPYVAIVNLNSAEKVARFFAVKYRTTVDLEGQLFIGSAGGWTGNGDYVNYPYVSDGEWNVLLIDTAEITAVTDPTLCGYARYDYYRGNGGSIDVAWVGFFETEEDALMYNAAHPLKEELPVVIPAADIFNGVVTDEGLIDVSGNNYTITKMGEVGVNDYDGVKCLTFERSGNYKVEGIDYARIENGFTMEVMFNTGDQSAYECICSNFHAGGYGMDDNKGQMYMNVHVNGDYYGPGMSLINHAPYHAVGVWDCEVCYLYVNGELAGTVDCPAPLHLPEDPGAEYLCIGGDSSADGNGESLFGGTIFFVRIYDEPVDAAQAAAMYQAAVAQ